MNRAISSRAALPPPPRGRDDPCAGTDSSDQGAYRRFDRRHETDRPEPPKRETFRPESPIPETFRPETPIPETSEPGGRDRESLHGIEGDDSAGENDLAFSLRSLLRLHAADLIVRLQRWGEQLDTREAILDLRATHLDLLQRRGRATSRRHARAPAADSDLSNASIRPEKSNASIRAEKSRWCDELESQRQAIARLLQDVERFADRLGSPPSV